MDAAVDRRLGRGMLTLRGYLLAAGSSVLALGLRELLSSSIGNEFPFIFAFAAVAISAAYGGWGPAIFTALATYVASDRLYISQGSTELVFSNHRMVALLSFFLTSYVIASLATSMRRAQARSQTHESILAVQHQRLQVTLASIGDAVLTTDSHGLVTFLNPVAEQLTGWSNAEALGLPILKIIPLFHQETGLRVENPVDRVLRERVVIGLANQVVIRRRSGEDIPIEDTAAPILMDDGSLQGAVLVFRDVSESRALGRELREAEWLYRTALEVGNASAWVWEIERDRVFGDVLSAPHSGLPSESSRQGESLDSFLLGIDPADCLRFRATLQRALKDGESYQCEYRVRAENGPERWIDGRGRVERNAEGQPTRMVNVSFDITERKNAEARRLASESRVRAIFDTALDAVLLMDQRGIITDWNPAAERIFGWTREEAEGSDLADRIIPARMREAHRRGLARFTSSKESVVLGQRLEFNALRRDGSEFPVELAINALLGSEPGLFVGFVRDISQRKADEAELDERARLSNLRAEIATLLSSSSELTINLNSCCELLVRHLDAAFARIWVLDPEGSILVLRASAGLYTHLDGLHSRIAMGQFKIGQIAQERRAHLTNDVARDPNISDAEWARREGMVAFAGYPLVASGRVLGVVALFSKQALSSTALGDLAPIADAIAANLERRNVDSALLVEKERAEAASRAKDNFLAALSHELRTPLMPVLLTATILREDQRLPDDVRTDLAMIERNIALEARLIDDLLDLTRIVKGKLQMRTEICDAHTVIAMAVEIVRDEAREKPVRIELDLAARRSRLRADPARLQQVIWNLLRNAIRFTPAEGRVLIRSRDQSADRLRIEVIDTGVGLAPGDLEPIFHPFEQVRLEGNHFGGLGLGLAIARAIVQLHGGLIRAESAGAGLGATFIIELSGAGESPSSEQTLRASPSEGGIAQSSQAPIQAKVLRLLLVEDHLPTSTILRRLLLNAGYEVVTAESVAGAVTAVEAEGPFDFLISDLGLPDGTGLEVIEKLRKLLPDLRAIALSGYGMEEDLKRSREAGFAVHLVKPVDFEDLRRALQKLGLPG